MKHNDRVIVTRGPHKSRFAVRVYSVSPDGNQVFVELKSGSGVQVGRRDVRLAKAQSAR